MNRSRARLVAALLTVWISVPVGLALARWPQWWAWIAPEQTPMTWFQSVALVLAAACSTAVAYVLRRTTGRAAPIWWLLAAGFAGLAVDERFALHERVRDGVLAPRGIAVPFLPWVAPGDFLLLVVALAGLAVLPFVWRALGTDQGAKWALAIGVVLAVVAVGMDSVDPGTWTVRAERVQQSAEEIIELGAALALLAAVVLRLLELVDRNLNVPERESLPAQAPEGPA